MAESNPGSPRWLAFLLALIGIVTLIIAFVHTPIADWQGTTYLLAGALAIITVAWLVVGIRGTYRLMGNMSGRTGVIVSGIGVVAAGVLVGTTVFADDWNVQNIVTTGLWISLGLMFMVGFDTSYKKMRAATTR